MNNPLAFTNATLVDPAEGTTTAGDLLVMDGRIADLGPDIFAGGMPDGAEPIDCQGHFLAPGLVDMRVTIQEPGDSHKESIATAAAAASAGGVTTLCVLPDTDPVIDNSALVEFMIARGRETGRVRLYPYGALTSGARGEQMSELGLLAEAGAIAFTDGGRAVGNALLMRRILSYASTFDLMVVQHPEEPNLARDGHMNEGELSTRLGLAGIPAVAEVMMIERDLRLVELTGARYHVAHVSTAAAIESIRRAKARGLPVTCDTAPPYFTLNETAIGDYRTFAKLSPPLRDEEDRLAVIEGLRDGVIDVIASDHLPQDPDSKRLPFAEAEAGGTGLETLLPIALLLYHNKVLDMAGLIARMTSAPARLMGLEGGRLARGAPADLVLFDAGAPWRVDADTLIAKSRNTPFDGLPVQGRCLRTVFGGRTVFQGKG